MRVGGAHEAGTTRKARSDRLDAMNRRAVYLEAVSGGGTTVIPAVPTGVDLQSGFHPSDTSVGSGQQVVSDAAAGAEVVGGFISGRLTADSVVIVGDTRQAYSRAFLVKGTGWRRE